MVVKLLLCQRNSLQFFTKVLKRLYVTFLFLHLSTSISRSQNVERGTCLIEAQKKLASDEAKIQEEYVKEVESITDEWLSDMELCFLSGHPLLISACQFLESRNARKKLKEAEAQKDIKVRAAREAYDVKVLGSSFFYYDSDEDGYGVKTDVIFDCEKPPKYSLFVGDCDDSRKDIHPGAFEPCEKDYNCDRKTLKCPPSSINANSFCVVGNLKISFKTENGSLLQRFVLETSNDALSWSKMREYHKSELSESISEQYTISNIKYIPGQNFIRVVGYSYDGRATYSSFILSECARSNLLKMSPNPSLGFVVVELPSDQTVSVELVVLNNSGFSVIKKRGFLNLGLNKLSFNISGLPSGVYTVVANYAGTSKSSKVVKK